MREYQFGVEGFYTTRPNNDGKQAGFHYPFCNDFQVSYTPVRSGIFNIYLFGVIEDANQFVAAIEVLQAAGENDVVVIHLSTDGGSLDATDTFITAMRDCEARIIVRATGGVHSAGSIILLNADEFILSENFNCLIHNGSTGSGGKYSDWKLQTRHTERYMERVMRKTYEGFLSDEEIEDLLAGKDMWLDAKEFGERWEKRNELLKGRIAQGQNDALKAIMETAEGLLAESEDAPPTTKKIAAKRKPKALPVEA